MVAAVVVSTAGCLSKSMANQEPTAPVHQITHGDVTEGDRIRETTDASKDSLVATSEPIVKKTITRLGGVTMAYANAITSLPVGHIVTVGDHVNGDRIWETTDSGGDTMVATSEPVTKTKRTIRWFGDPGTARNENENEISLGWPQGHRWGLRVWRSCSREDRSF